MRRCAAAVSIVVALAGSAALAGGAPGARAATAEHGRGEQGRTEQGRGEQGRGDEAAADRVLVLSLPHLTWEDLEAAETPNLDRLFEDSALGNLSLRVRRRKTDLETGYATIGAGTRAEGPSTGDLALQAGETFEHGTATDAYRRRMGRVPDAPVLVLSYPDFVDRNEGLLFDAEIGALGTALAEAGHHRAVIGNGDRRLDPFETSEVRRPVAAALMDGAGTVPGGRIDSGLLRRDPGAPFGLRLDHGAVLDAFDEEWTDGSVVVVEASDLARAEAYRGFVAPRLRDATTADAIERTDRLVGELLARVDAGHDAVVGVAPGAPRGAPTLNVAAVRAPGVEPSLLTSPTTRRAGFVTIYDVAATVVDLVGVERPGSMEGRAFETGGAVGPAAERIEHLRSETEEAELRDRIVGPVTATFVGLQLALALAGVLALRFGRGRGVVGAAATVVLGILPATYLAGLVDFSGVGFAAYLSFVFAVAVAIAALARLVSRGDPVIAVAAVLVVVVGVIVGNVVLADSALQLNTVFGDSPIVAGRFTGINNLSFAQVAGGGILLAVLLAHRAPGRRGALGAAGLLALLLVVDGLPAWGADVGGVLTAVPAFGYVAYRLWGARVGPRTLVLLGVATLVVLGAFTLFDLAQPAGERSHLGRLVEQVDAEGADALVTVVLRKLAANIRVITSSVWLLMVPGALAFAAYLVWRSPHQRRIVEARIPRFRIALVGVLVAGTLGFALNDSGIAVPGMILGVLNPVMVYLAMRLQPDADPPGSHATRSAARAAVGPAAEGES